MSAPREQAGVSALDWTARAALGTLAYYLAAFTFEVGYFWEMGVELMSTFSISEHIVHAAGHVSWMFLGFAGLLFFILSPSVVMSGWTGIGNDPIQRATVTEESANRSELLRRKRIGRALMLPMLLLLVVVTGSFVYEAVRDSSLAPNYVVPLLIASAMLIHVLEAWFGRKERMYLFPLAGVALLTFPALGAAEFTKVSSSRPIVVTLNANGKLIDCNLIFLGTDRVIVQKDRRTYLLPIGEDAMRVSTSH